MSVGLAGVLIALAGAAIGATSIGGLFVVPILTAIGEVAVPRAIAATSFGFLMTGIWTWRRQNAAGATPPPAPIALHVAAFAGAIGGALAVNLVPGSWPRAWIALLAFASGVYSLAGAARSTHATRALPARWRAVALGLFVGAGSALSGTGGPVMLLPVLLLLGVPAAAAVPAALAIQIPIAVAATGTYLLAGTLDIGLGLAVGAALVAGAWTGHRLAARADPLHMRRLVALVLIATGLWYGGASWFG